MLTASTIHRVLTAHSDPILLQMERCKSVAQQIYHNWLLCGVDCRPLERQHES